MEDPRGNRGESGRGRHGQVGCEQVGHLPADRTRSDGKSITTTEMGRSGAGQKKLRADDQVWRNLGEFAVFDKVVEMIKYGASGWYTCSTTEGRGMSGSAFPRRPWERPARGREICAQMIKYGGSSGKSR